MGARASVIVRTYNSARTVVATLRSLREQTLDVEIVIVDSGSDDGTMSLIEGDADAVVHLRRSDFSYGRALNAGAEIASAPVHIALSSHCVLPRRDWIERAVLHVEAGAVGVVGQRSDADRNRLRSPFKADQAYLVSHPFWGFSNHASAWSRDRWVLNRFDETLRAAEDKEWSWRATQDGGHILVDPNLTVPAHHRRSAGTVPYYRRLVREITALPRPLPAYGLHDAALDLVRAEPRDPLVGTTRRLGRTRLIKAAARWYGGKRLPRPVGEVLSSGHPGPAVVDSSDWSARRRLSGNRV